MQGNPEALSLMYLNISRQVYNNCRVVAKREAGTGTKCQYRCLMSCGKEERLWGPTASKINAGWPYKRPQGQTPTRNTS